MDTPPPLDVYISVSTLHSVHMQSFIGAPVALSISVRDDLHTDYVPFVSKTFRSQCTRICILCFMCFRRHSNVIFQNNYWPLIYLFIWISLAIEIEQLFY